MKTRNLKLHDRLLLVTITATLTLTACLFMLSCNKREQVVSTANILATAKTGNIETYYVDAAHTMNTTITKTDVLGTYYVHSKRLVAMKYVGYSYSHPVAFTEVEKAIEAYEDAHPDDLTFDEPMSDVIHSFTFPSLGCEMLRLGNDWDCDGKRINRPLPCPRACD